MRIQKKIQSPHPVCMRDFVCLGGRVGGGGPRPGSVILLCCVSWDPLTPSRSAHGWWWYPGPLDTCNLSTAGLQSFVLYYHMIIKKETYLIECVLCQYCLLVVWVQIFYTTDFELKLFWADIFLKVSYLVTIYKHWVGSL